MSEIRDSVFAIVADAQGRVLGARLANDADSGLWSLPAGPVAGQSARSAVASWCQKVLELPVTAGHLVSVRFLDTGASAFGFQARLEADRAEEFTAHGGAVIGRFFDPEELRDVLSEFEQGVLAASLRGIEEAGVVEWTAYGEPVSVRAAPWKRMMPTLPEPFGPQRLADPARTNRNRPSKRR